MKGALVILALALGLASAFTPVGRVPARSVTTFSYLDSLSKPPVKAPKRPMGNYLESLSSAPAVEQTVVEEAAESFLEDVAPETVEKLAEETPEVVEDATPVAETLAPKVDVFVDAEALIEAQKFKYSPDELIGLAKGFLNQRSFTAQGDMMCDTAFEFLGPVVGPLDKESYLSAISGFDVFGIFPDLNPQYFGFTVDPFDAGRVWVISRSVGSNPESGKSFESPPQAVSLTFNEKGKVTKFTIGHVMDRSVGNTGGMGGLFGPLYAIGRGLPFPEGQPWKPSKRYRLFQFVGAMAKKLKKD